MTEKQTSSSRNNEAEFLLSELTDETPSSSSEESEDNQKNGNIAPDSELQQISDSRTLANVEEETLCKFEKETINKILTIKSEAEKIKAIIENLKTEELEKDAKMYEEILISKTLSLDTIETKGIQKIKDIRKESIIFIQDCLAMLDVNKS